MRTFEIKRIPWPEDDSYLSKLERKKYNIAIKNLQDTIAEGWELVSVIREAKYESGGEPILYFKRERITDEEKKEKI